MLALYAFFCGATACTTTRTRPRRSFGDRSRYYPVYTVRAADTVYSIARMYDVSVERLVAVNGLKDPSKIRVGQKLLIPQLPPPPPPRPTCARSSSAPDTGSSQAFMWPVEDRWKVKELDRNRVYIQAPPGSPVWAASDGKVVFSGTKPDFGLLVIIRHSRQKKLTLYGGNRRLCVKKGATVRRGQVVALVGYSSRRKGRHLYYEIRSYK